MTTLTYQYILIYYLYFATILKFLKLGVAMDIFLNTIGAVNDATRVEILHFINTNGEVCVCDIENSFSMIQSRISRHLKILKDAGFLKVERRGRWAYYSVRTPMDEFRQSILKEIGCLDIKIPLLNKGCKSE